MNEIKQGGRARGNLVPTQRKPSPSSLHTAVTYKGTLVRDGSSLSPHILDTVLGLRAPHSARAPCDPEQLSRVCNTKTEDEVQAPDFTCPLAAWQHSRAGSPPTYLPINFFSIPATELPMLKRPLLRIFMATCQKKVGSLWVPQHLIGSCAGSKVDPGWAEGTDPSITGWSLLGFLRICTFLVRTLRHLQAKTPWLLLGWRTV